MIPVKMEEEKIIEFLCVQGLALLEFIFDDEEYANIEDLEFVRTYLQRGVVNSTLRLENYVERIIPSYSDEEFQSHFRMKRATFMYTLQLIKPSLLRQIPGHKTISAEKQFMIALWKMATPDSYRSICEKFNVGRSTALKAVKRVTKALIKLSSVFITWPNREKTEEIILGFEAVSGFPKVIGAIDSMHINIRAPHINPESYVNRKGRHSIQLQAVCDHERKFIHCLTGHVGSVHDQRVLRLSEVNSYLDKAERFPNGSHLIGDSAYTIHEHLMVPYRDNGHLTNTQKNYNFCHSSARIVIERAFGLLKGRFRGLLTVLDMERVDLIPEVVMACCVLHNICLLHNDELQNINIGVDLGNNDNQIIHPRRGHISGLHKRDRICNNLIMRNI